MGVLPPFSINGSISLRTLKKKNQSGKKKKKKKKGLQVMSQAAALASFQ